MLEILQTDEEVHSETHVNNVEEPCGRGNTGNEWAVEMKPERRRRPKVRLPNQAAGPAARGFEPPSIFVENPCKSSYMKSAVYAC